MVLYPDEKLVAFPLRLLPEVKDAVKALVDVSYIFHPHIPYRSMGKSERSPTLASMNDIFQCLIAMGLEAAERKLAEQLSAQRRWLDEERAVARFFLDHPDRDVARPADLPEGSAARAALEKWVAQYSSPEAVAENRAAPYPLPEDGMDRDLAADNLALAEHCVRNTSAALAAVRAAIRKPAGGGVAHG
jgi:hypothetical protein